MHRRSAEKISDGTGGLCLDAFAIATFQATGVHENRVTSCVLLLLLPTPYHKDACSRPPPSSSPPQPSPPTYLCHSPLFASWLEVSHFTWNLCSDRHIATSVNNHLPISKLRVVAEQHRDADFRALQGARCKAECACVGARAPKSRPKKKKKKETVKPRRCNKRQTHASPTT